MPEEIFIIVVVSILAGTFSGVVKMVLEYMKGRQGTVAGPVSGGEALTTSELERLIEKAVRKANADLVDRVEALEQGEPADGRISLPPAEDEELAPVPRRQRGRA